MSALNKMTVEDLDVKGKRVLVRCDFNVKMENGVITSDKRIVASLPTIQYLIKNGAKVILCSHLGRPKGEVNPEFSMKPVAARLSELLGQEVKMADDVVGESAQKLAAELKDGEVLLLENVRFEPGETKNDVELSKKFAALADLYVNEIKGKFDYSLTDTFMGFHCGNTCSQKLCKLLTKMEQTLKLFHKISPVAFCWDVQYNIPYHKNKCPLQADMFWKWRKRK